MGPAGELLIRGSQRSSIASRLSIEAAGRASLVNTLPAHLTSRVRRLLPWIGVLVLALVAVVPAWAPMPITSCTSAQVQSNVARRGSHAFACSGTIHFSAPLVVSQLVSVDATGQSVTVQWTAGIGQSRQALVVDAGSLTLTSIAISGGVAVGALGTAGPTGVPSGDEVPQGQARQRRPGRNPRIGHRSTDRCSSRSDVHRPGATVFLNAGSISGAVASGGNGGRGGTGRTGGSAWDFMVRPGTAAAVARAATAVMEWAAPSTSALVRI